MSNLSALTLAECHSCQGDLANSKRKVREAYKTKVEAWNKYITTAFASPEPYYEACYDYEEEVAVLIHNFKQMRRWH